VFFFSWISPHHKIKSFIFINIAGCAKGYFNFPLFSITSRDIPA